MQKHPHAPYRRAISCIERLLTFHLSAGLQFSIERQFLRGPYGRKGWHTATFRGAEVTTTEFDESVSQINRFMHENGDKAVCINSLRIAAVKI